MVARPPLWLIAAILADGLVLGALIVRGFWILPEGEEIFLVVCAVCAFAIYAGVALWLWHSPSPHRYGLAMGLYVVGLVITGGWLALLALGLGMSSTLSSHDLRLVGSAVALLLAQLALSVGAYRVAGRAGVRSRLEVARTGVIQINVVGALLLVATLPVGISLEGVAARRGNRSFGALQAAVYRVQGCAARYVDAHPEEGYPPTLEAMGPRGTKCLDEATVAGRDNDGTAIEYTTTRDERGRVRSFLVTARGRAYGKIESVTGDTSGLARNDGTIFGESLHLIASTRSCLELFRLWFPDQRFPATLLDLARALEGHNDGRPGAPLFGGCALIHDYPGSLTERTAAFAAGGTHQLSYRPNEADDYVLEVRPTRYGKTAIQSYMMRRGGAVHITLLDRPATEDDPDVEACVYPMRGSCVFLPGPPPVVAFVHDTVVVRDSSYTLAARDPPTPAPPLDASLRFSYECYVETPLSRSVPGTFDPERDHTCRPAPNWRKDGLVVVRLWVVDRTGARSVYEDTLPVVGEKANENQE